MNEAEFRNMMFQSGRQDEHSFYGMLFRAIYKADSCNRAKLRLGFPEEVESVERWTREEGYAKALREAFNEGRGSIDGTPVRVEQTL